MSMTDPRAVAEQVLGSIDKTFGDYDKEVDKIAHALADAERRGLERAAGMAEEKAERSLRAKHLDIPEYNFGYRGGLRGLADEIRQALYLETQAQADKEE